MKNTVKDATALVMGLSIVGLSVVRSLGRQGIKVVGVHEGKRPPGSYSRFLTYVRKPQTESESDKLDFFVNLAQKINSRRVIIPTFDKDVLFLSRHKKILEKYFLFYLPPHKLVKSLTSKIHLVEIAKRHRLRLPASIQVSDQKDIMNIPESFFPCVLKPEEQTLWTTKEVAKIGVRGLKALPIRNRNELLSYYDGLKETGLNLIVQKMVAGPDENHLDYHALTDPDGQVIAEFVGKKIRLSPPHFGMGCYVESVKSERIVAEGRRIIRSLGYTGMANINFKKDDRDGKLYFFELNPRFSLWNGLDVACGVNFPYYYYKLCLGEKISPQKDYLTGKRWLNLSRDIRGLRTLLADSSLTWPQWIKSVIDTDIGAIYAADDPMPTMIRPYLFFKNRLGEITSID